MPRRPISGKSHVPGSRARVSLDEADGRSAPAALRLPVERGTVCVAQTLQGAPIVPSVLSGLAKAPAPAQTVQGVLQVFGAGDDEPILTVAVPIAHSTTWKEFSRLLLLPISATCATLSFEANGAGEVLLDDISLEPASQVPDPANDPGPSNG